MKEPYKELTKVAQKQLGDPNNIPKEIYAFGSKKTRSEYCEHVSDNYFKCASPIENDEIILEMAQLFPGEGKFLSFSEIVLNSFQRIRISIRILV